MDRIRPIFERLLEGDFTVNTPAESFNDCTVTGEGKVILPVKAEAVRGGLESLNGIGWTLFVKLGGQDAPHTLSQSRLEELDAFVQGVNSGAIDSSNASVKLFIKKEPGPLIDVFCPDAFFYWLNSLEIRDALNRFQNLVSTNSVVTFRHPSFAPGFSTGCFFFHPTATPLAPSAEQIKRRTDCIAIRREQTVSDWETLVLFPDDFRWRDGKTIAGVEHLFAKIENFLGVVSLADSTMPSTNGFVVRVKGHVLREQTVLWKDIPTVPDVPLRELFDWTYREAAAGPLLDKLGLVRNFVSLYWKEGIFGMDARVTPAVRAGFGMYLRRNLKDFVELRAKVASFLLELDAKASKTVETATGNLEKNLYGIVTFVTSVVLIKAIQDKTFTGAFSSQVAVLGWTLCGISALHAFLAGLGTFQELERATELYNDLRSLYGAFFSEQDFDSVFGSKGISPIHKTKDFVKRRLLMVIGIWILTLVSAASLIGYLKVGTSLQNPSRSTPHVTLGTNVSQSQSPSPSAPINRSSTNGYVQKKSLPPSLNLFPTTNFPSAKNGKP